MELSISRENASAAVTVRAALIILIFLLFDNDGISLIGLLDLHVSVHSEDVNVEARGLRMILLLEDLIEPVRSGAGLE